MQYYLLPLIRNHGFSFQTQGNIFVHEYKNERFRETVEPIDDWSSDVSMKDSSDSLDDPSDDINLVRRHCFLLAGSAIFYTNIMCSLCYCLCANISQCPIVIAQSGRTKRKLHSLCQCHANLPYWKHWYNCILYICISNACICI